MALRVANQRPLFGLGHPAGDSLADLDGQRFGGYTVVLGAMAIAEVDRAQRPSVIFQQVDAALVVGQQGRDGLADGLADLRHAADVREARPQLLDGVEMLRPGVRFRQPPVLQHRMIGGPVDGGFPGRDHREQRLRHPRVELLAGLRGNFVEDPVARPGTPVWPVARHRLKGIAGVNDAGLDGNLPSLEPIRISVTIPSFVLSADDRADPTQERH